LNTHAKEFEAPESLVFLNTKAAAAFLGVSPRTLERWRWEGVGPRHRKHGARCLYSRDDLLSWSAAQTRRSTSDSGQGRDAA